MLESIAFDFAQALKILRSYRPDQQFEDVRVVGGGASNALWNQIKSDVLGLHYKRLCRDDTAALWCAIIAGHSIGAFSDMAEMAIRFAKTTDNIEPNRSQHRLYEKYIKAYGKMFDQLHDTFSTIAALGGG